MNEVAIVVILVGLFFCSVAGSVQRLPKLLSHPNLITEKYGKLTSAWAQEAIGVPEGHEFLNEVGANIFSTVPRIGIKDYGFDVDTLLNNTRLTNGLRGELLSPATDFVKILQDGKSFNEILRGVLSVNNLHGEIQTIHFWNTVLTEMDKDRIENQSLNRQYRRLIGLFEHGTAVAHLLAGQPPFGVSTQGKLDALFLYDKGVGREFQYLGQIAARKSLPDILNLSGSFGSDSEEGKIFAPSELLLQTVRKITSKTLAVTSAGNEFPHPIESVKRKLSERMIVVGSSDPTGRASSFSPAGETVTLCAPSDEYVQAITGNGCVTFSGTSGATPLVTGALADALSILPTLTISEAIHLLQKTAITRGSVLILNYYRLVRIAARLANTGWPEHRGEIFNDELYDFTAEAQRLLASADQSSSTEEIFKNLRKAFFLDPNNTTVKERLADMYSQAMLTAQALFYSGYQLVSDRNTNEYDFLTAVADVDTEQLTKMLPVLREGKLLEKPSFTEVLGYMDKQDRYIVIKFLEEKEIASENN